MRPIIDFSELDGNRSEAYTLRQLYEEANTRRWLNKTRGKGDEKVIRRIVSVVALVDDGKYAESWKDTDAYAVRWALCGKK